MCLRFLLLEFILEIKKYTTTWDTFITISLPESFFFYDFKGLMPRASVETCLGDVINGMIASGQFCFLMNEVYHDVDT